MGPRHRTWLVLAVVATAAAFIGYKLYVASKRKEEEEKQEQLKIHETQRSDADVVVTTQPSPAELAAAKRPEGAVDSVYLTPKMEEPKQQQKAQLPAQITQSGGAPAMLSTESGTSVNVSTKKDKKKKKKKKSGKRKKSESENSLGPKDGSGKNLSPTAEVVTAKEVQGHEETKGVKTADLMSSGETKDVKTANELTISIEEGGVRTAENLMSQGETKNVDTAKKIE